MFALPCTKTVLTKPTQVYMLYPFLRRSVGRRSGVYSATEYRGGGAPAAGCSLLPANQDNSASLGIPTLAFTTLRNSGLFMA